MATVSKVEGLGTVVDNLKKEQKALGKRVEGGLKLAGLYLQRVSQKKVPVDFGILKASAFTRAFGKGFDTQVNVGYTASYAIFVHEAVGMKLKGQPRQKPSKGRYWDPQGRAQAKFLEEPFRTERPKLIQIVLDAAKIK